MSKAKILVISDVHGHVTELRWILKNETADAMFFLGDGLYDLDGALNLMREPLPYPVYRVRGNMDPGFEDPMDGLVPIAGVLFYYTHGNLLYVKSGYDELSDAAQARGADVALFGHTHRRGLIHDDTPDLPTLFNPGSVKDGGSYGIITVEDDGSCSYDWKRVTQ